MVYVRMLIHRTGSRYDGQEWPGYLDEIDVPEWEAKLLIEEGMAQSPDIPLLDRGYDVLKVPAVDYESGLHVIGAEEDDEDPRYSRTVHTVDDEGTPHSDDFDNDFDGADSDNDFDDEDETPVIKRPYGNAAKQEWVEYVVARGFIEYGEAKKMTIAALKEMDS